MKESINLTEKYDKTAEKLRQEKKNFLSETLKRGKICREIREEMNCYKDFKEWSLKTGYSISTLNRDINRYELYELMKEETGRETVESLSMVSLARINKLRKQNEEKFMELVELIDSGIDSKEIKEFLEENVKEEIMQLKGEELSEYFENMEKETSKIDKIRVKQSTVKKLMRAIKRVLVLILGCTKLNVVKRNRELSRKIEEINYETGVLSIS